MAIIDLSGRIFGRLTVQGRAPNRGRTTCWNCQCECGVECIVRGCHLSSGHTLSCGCLQREYNDWRSAHSLKKDRAYRIWCGMKTRCFNVRRSEYKNYGARGITVCERWSSSFAAFLQDMGRPQNGMTIDRINNDGNYEPGNCKWATTKEQSRNNRRNRWLVIGGERMVVADAAERFDRSVALIKMRLRRGYPDELAVFGPKHRSAIPPKVM